MKTLASFLVGLAPLLLLADPTPLKSAESWVPQVKTALKNRVKNSSLRQSELSVVVSRVSPQSVELIYELNSKQKRTPASLTKLVTGAAVLNTFPVDHKFKTELLQEGKLKDGVLTGNLILKGYGDPAFVSESLWRLANKLTRTGIKKIKGNIYVDDSYFDGKRFDESRTTARVDRAYDAPVSAVSFNWNSVNVFVRPGKKKGAPARVFIDPENDYIALKNKAKTVKGRKKGLSVKRKITKAQSGLQETIIVKGVIGLKREEEVFYKSVIRPSLWSGHQLKSFLERRGIEVTGEIKRKKAGKKAEVVADIESKPVDELVKAMMKFSNNFVAEMLTKNMGVYKFSEPGTIKKGMKVIHNFLKEAKIKDYSLESPSGLSKKNKFRALDLQKLLLHSRKKFTIYPEFMSALPVAGRDGTLKKRMNGTAAEEWVRAKTGMLNGVAGLAGFAGRESGERLVFVFLFNGRARKVLHAKKLFDNLAQELVK